LVPILAYANNDTMIYGDGINYNLSWAPHHLGHWPICYITPEEQEQMPIEETGNMMNMITAVVQFSLAENSSITTREALKWLEPYAYLLSIWGEYLRNNLPDPEDQLCTDDFEGPSPHNANLAAKGIIGINAYSILLGLDGKSDESRRYLEIAQQFAYEWMVLDIDIDFTHYKLQYNQSDTWSQKYNLVYQKILNISIYPPSVFVLESDYYQTQMREYGFPLDDRAAFTKTDWSMWSSCLGTREQFNKIVEATYKFATNTPNRVPFTDWYNTTNAVQMGFQARPVIGGLYMPMVVPVLN